MSDLGDKLTSKDPVSFFSRPHVEGGSSLKSSGAAGDQWSPRDAPGPPPAVCVTFEATWPPLGAVACG